MANRRVTIKDIAAAAELTPTAVSRALRDKSDISLPTKQRVLKIAGQLGYINNSTASSLRRGKTNLIAVVYDNLINPYFSIMTSHLQESLNRHGYSFLTFTSPSGYLDKELFGSIVSRNVDGVISFMEPTEEVNGLTEIYDVPVLVLGRKTTYKNMDFIDTDEKKGGSLAACHLMDCGCKHILYVSEGLHITCAKERYDGFKEALEARGLFDESLAIFLHGDSLEARLDEFLAKGLKFDGIFCFNDLLAFETIYLLELRGIKDIKTVGYDNIQEEMRIPRKLTTIGTDKRQMAEVATEGLLYKIEHKVINRPFRKIHDVYLVKGETT